MDTALASFGKKWGMFSYKEIKGFFWYEVKKVEKNVSILFSTQIEPMMAIQTVNQLILFLENIFINYILSSLKQTTFHLLKSFDFSD